VTHRTTRNRRKIKGSKATLEITRFLRPGKDSSPGRDKKMRFRLPLSRGGMRGYWTESPDPGKNKRRGF